MQKSYKPAKRILGVVLLNAGITLAELIGGIFSGSLSLVSDAFHNLSDTLAIMLSYIARKIAQKDATKTRTYGYRRSEILSALINSIVLIVLAVFLTAEAIKRFFDPEKINSDLMIVVAVIGLLGNLFSVLLLRKEADESLNIKSSYLHLLSDALSSISVIIGAILIRLFNVYWLDPVITLLVSAYILFEAVQIAKKAVDILMQSAPDIDYQQLAAEIKAVKGVKDIHHVHAWHYDERQIVFDAHIDFEDQMLSEVEKIYPEIIYLLKEKHGFTHITLQAEVHTKDRKNLFFSNEDERKQKIEYDE